MCGITGFWQPHGFSQNAAKSIVDDMALAIQSRGPDSSGSWLDCSAGFALAHRRLAIIDLSEAGHQPMISRSGRYVISFNGEIYNHNDLRKALESEGLNCRWRGHSDTETLLLAIETWGITDAVKRSVGMFAFALWDSEEHSLTLGRDRLGEKPLYYGFQGNTFLFGSELKSFKKNPHFTGQISRDSLSIF